MSGAFWDRNNIKQVAEKGKYKCVYRSQGMWCIFHLIYSVSHISPSARVSKHSMIHRFAHCARCMISSHKQQMPSIKHEAKLITGFHSVSPCRSWHIIMNHSLHVGKIDRDFINFPFSKFSLCNKCLLNTRKVIKYQFHVE